MSDFIRNFISDDEEKLEALIRSHPVSLTVQQIADFLGCDDESVRRVLENGAIGLAWKQTGKTRHGYYIPTGKFVRWYMDLR